jgi:hypothetical protein
MYIEALYVVFFLHLLWMLMRYTDTMADVTCLIFYTQTLPKYYTMSFIAVPLLLTTTLFKTLP